MRLLASLVFVPALFMQASTPVLTPSPVATDTPTPALAPTENPNATMTPIPLATNTPAAVNVVVGGVYFTCPAGNQIQIHDGDNSNGQDQILVFCQETATVQGS